MVGARVNGRQVPFEYHLQNETGGGDDLTELQGPQQGAG